MSVFLSMVEEISAPLRVPLQIASRWAILQSDTAGLVCARQWYWGAWSSFPKRVVWYGMFLLNVSGVRCSSLRKRAIAKLGRDISQPVLSRAHATNETADPDGFARSPVVRSAEHLLSIHDERHHWSDLRQIG